MFVPATGRDDVVYDVADVPAAVAVPYDLVATAVVVVAAAGDDDDGDVDPAANCHCHRQQLHLLRH